MSGAPIRHERNRLVREAIMRGIKEGIDPVDYVHDLVIQPVKDVLADAEATHGEKMAAVNFLADRIDGKAAQEILVDKTETRLVDAGLVGTMGELLRLAKAAGKKELVPVERVVHEVGEDGPTDS
jgi:hypothetical protein